MIAFVGGAPATSVSPASAAAPGLRGAQPAPTPTSPTSLPATAVLAGLGAAAASRRGRVARRATDTMERKTAVAASAEEEEEEEAAVEPVKGDAPSDPAPPPEPSWEEKGATYVADTGDKVLFAGGLVGGQSAFSRFDYNFDPLGISERLEFALPWLRESEVKHGRIAMLAFVGLIAPTVFQLPGLEELSPACSASGKGGELRVVEAHDACIASEGTMLGFGPLWFILVAVATIEVGTTIMKLDKSWGGLTIDNAGDYPMRKELGAALGQLPKNERAMAILKLQELKHCRLAMIGFSGAWVQGALTATPFPSAWF